MKLCIPVGIFPPEIGGPATYVPELAKRLARRGHEVHVVTFGTPEYEERDGYVVHRLPYPGLPKQLAFPLRVARAGLLCARVVKHHGLELIYAQEYISGMMGLIAKRLTGTPMLYKFVGDWAWEVAFGRGWTRKLLHEFYDSPSPNLMTSLMMLIQRRIGNSCVRIVAPSYYLRSVIERWGISTPVVVIPNAVDFYSCDRERCRRELGLRGTVLLSVGRLVAWKGFHLVVEALSSLEREVSYLIIGDGPYRGRIEELKLRLGLENVHLLGRMPKEETLRYLCASDLFVLPSCYEGMSHVILEAMSCRTPVLASDIPPNRELIEDGITGFLVKPERGEIERKLSDILERADLDAVAERAYRAVRQRNSWEGHISALEEVMELCKGG